jgi:hypothetical protein
MAQPGDGQLGIRPQAGIRAVRCCCDLSERHPVLEAKWRYSFTTK